MQIRRIGLFSPKAYAALMSLLLVGTLLGSLFCAQTDNGLTDELGSLQSGFVSLRQDPDLASVLLRTLSSSTIFLAALFVSGFCAVGHPIAAAVLLLRGMGFGVVLSQLYLSFGSRGVLWSLALVLPNAVVSGAALVFGARESLNFSNMYILFSLSDRQVDGLKEQLRLYCAKFLVLEAVLAVSAGADCIITWIMKGFVLE